MIDVRNEIPKSIKEIENTQVEFIQIIAIIVVIYI